MTLSELALNAILFCVALLATAVATPLARRIALRTGFVDRPAPYKYHRVATPYLGGAAIAAAVLAIVVAGLVLAPAMRREFLAIALGGAAVAGIGLLDDWRTLQARPRLAVQALAAAGLWAAGIRVGPTGVAALDFAATVFVVLAVTNAINLLDNMDGLSAGTAGIASLFLFVIAYQEGQHLVAVMTVVLAGACFGFLPYNFPPARIFLGDAGTLFLGFLLSVGAIKLELDGLPVATRAVVPFLVLAVPLFDMTLVVLSRWRAKRPVFRGGTDHSSHRLVILGLSPRRTALITYAAGFAAGAAALLLLRVGTTRLAWTAIGVVAILGVILLVTFERVYRGRTAIVEPTAVEDGTAQAPVLS